MMQVWNVRSKTKWGTKEKVEIDSEKIQEQRG